MSRASSEARNEMRETANKQLVLLDDMKDFNEKRGTVEAKPNADFDDIELQKRYDSERKVQPAKAFKYGAQPSDFEM